MATDREVRDLLVVIRDALDLPWAVPGHDETRTDCLRERVSRLLGLLDHHVDNGSNADYVVESLRGMLAKCPVTYPVARGEDSAREALASRVQPQADADEDAADRADDVRDGGR